MKDGLFCLLFGLVLAGPGVFLLWRRLKLKKECTAQAVGTISDIKTRSRKSDLMTFTYSAGGAEYAQSSNVGTFNVLSKRVAVGGSVTVFYDPSNPQRSYAKEGKTGLLWWLLLIALGAIMMWGGVLMLINR